MVRSGAEEGYTLVICEKPDAARRVSDALSDGKAESSFVEGVQVLRFQRGSEKLVVCSAQGHLYGVSDPFEERTVYPVFDAEWYSSDLVDDDSANVGRRIAAIRRLARGAARFINACDFDVEGETIGFNLLRYACGGKEAEALRAKFSTLTKEDLVDAFRLAESQADHGLARAGRARHLIDFLWGVNLSRALSQSALSFGHGYRTVSMGRVQGPTLNFLIEREREIRGFVPVPFWRVAGVFEKNGGEMIAEYSRTKVENRSQAEKVVKDCTGKAGLVDSVSRSTARIPPYPPFNIGDLQKEAYRVFGLSPARTLQAAEKLYLSALISYPRTSSQKLPPSINYGVILRGLSAMPEYSQNATKVLAGPLSPVHGANTDSAHPAIHPTGNRPNRALNSTEAGVFDLVARRFMAAFGPPAKRELVSIGISVGEHRFRLGGGRTVAPGWMSYYGRSSGMRDVESPVLLEGDRLKVVGMKLAEGLEPRPDRYNQSTLLEKMERERMGTKATRADVISTIVGRGYVTGEAMVVSDLGLSVIETMERYAPSIVTTALTRDIEDKLQRIESGDGDDKELLRATVRSIAAQLQGLNSSEDAVGREIDGALAAASSASYVLGNCPVCKTGKLRTIRSKKTKKRFVGCSNFPTRCRASAPLPQRGTVKATAKPCRYCAWPVVYVMGGRKPWRLCVNPDCPYKKGKKREV